MAGTLENADSLEEGHCPRNKEKKGASLRMKRPTWPKAAGKSSKIRIEKQSNGKALPNSTLALFSESWRQNKAKMPWDEKAREVRRWKLRA